MRKVYTRHKDMHGAKIYEGDYIKYPKAPGFTYKVLWGMANDSFANPWLYTWIVEGTNGLRTYLYDSSTNLERVRKVAKK